MKSIQKLKISNATISTGLALTLMITACSKKDNVAPLGNTIQSEESGARLSAVSTKPGTVDIEVKGLDNEQHLNRKFQYKRIDRSGDGGWGGRGDRGWKEDLLELTFDAVQQKFIATNIYPTNRITTITGPFTDGLYTFRVAYQVPGDEDRWFYTAHNQPVQIRAKPKTPSSPQGGNRKSMTIEADMAAAKAFPTIDRGVVVLNFIELNNIELNDIGSAIIKTRVSPTSSDKASDYQKIPASSSIRILCDYINNRLVIKGLASGLAYDFKIDFDGVEVEIQNVTASGVSIAPTVN